MGHSDDVLPLQREANHAQAMRQHPGVGRPLELQLVVLEHWQNLHCRHAQLHQMRNLPRAACSHECRTVLHSAQLDGLLLHTFRACYLQQDAGS